MPSTKNNNQQTKFVEKEEPLTAAVRSLCSLPRRGSDSTSAGRTEGPPKKRKAAAAQWHLILIGRGTAYTYTCG